MKALVLLLYLCMVVRGFVGKKVGFMALRGNRQLSTNLAFSSAVKKTAAKGFGKVQASFPDYTGFALLFDCDGVIVETEEMHRQAYNAAFEEFGLRIDGEEVVWSNKYYDILQNTVGGGKPKMMHHFDNVAKKWPEVSKSGGSTPDTVEAQTKLVDELQDAKVAFYKKLIADGMCKTRPGIKELMDEAINNPTLKVGICTAALIVVPLTPLYIRPFTTNHNYATATKGGFFPLVDALLGQKRLKALDVLIAGDDVSNKKPDPLIYNTARERLGLDAKNCVVIEDSMVGLRAAKGAGMNCVITYTPSTQSQDFYGEGADAKLLDMANVRLADVFDPIVAGGRELLEKHRDIKNKSEGEGEGEDESATMAKIVGWSPDHMIRANSYYN